MADKTIPQLPTKTSVSTGDLIIIEDSVTSTTMSIDSLTFLEEGSPYVDINSDGEEASAPGADAIAIGGNSEASSTNSIAIGKEVTISEGGRNSLAIGSNIDLEGGESGVPPEMIILGSDITIGSGSGSSIVIGKNSSSTNVQTISIGSEASATSANGIAIGEEAKSQAGGAVQLGTGTNTNQNTLQLFNNIIANAEGLYTSYTSPQSYTPLDTDNVTSHLAAIDEAISRASGGGTPITPTISTQNAGVEIDDEVTTLNFVGNGVTATDAGSGVTNVTIPGSGETYVEINSSGTVPTATGTNSIAIGPTTRAVNSSAVAIGSGAQAEGSSSIQLGSGTNRSDNTLQFRSNVIASTDGLFIESTTGQPTSNMRSGTPRWDATTGTLYISTGTAWRSVQLS